MKNLKSFNFLVAFAVAMSTIFSSVASYAQSVPEKVDVDINTNGGGSVWYGQPWVWAVGGGHIYCHHCGNNQRQ